MVKTELSVISAARDEDCERGQGEERAAPQFYGRFHGRAAGRGIASGRCTVVSDWSKLRWLQNGFGFIIVCDSLAPGLMSYMPRIRALAVEDGDSLLIASQYARECAIPVVVGVKGLLKTVGNLDFIRVDGAKGTVEVLR